MRPRRRPGPHPRGGLAGRRSGRLRPGRRLPRAAAPPLVPAVGQVPHPRPPRARRGGSPPAPVPPSPDPTLVHGDYRLDNVMLAPDRGHGGPGRPRLGDEHPRRPARRPRPAHGLLGRRRGPLRSTVGGASGRRQAGGLEPPRAGRAVRRASGRDAPRSPSTSCSATSSRDHPRGDPPAVRHGSDPRRGLREPGRRGAGLSPRPWTWPSATATGGRGDPRRPRAGGSGSR